MANKLGGTPSSGGWKPPSAREHPPAAGAHDAGSKKDHGGDEAGKTLPNAVSRPPNGIRTK